MLSSAPPVTAERLDAYMARIAGAYYAARDPFRDFVTAPEISQAFGEVLGAWSAVVWAGMGRPAAVLWVELGPGRGTLMRDALRAVRQVAPDFAAAARVHLVERSARLRGVQGEVLGEEARGVVWLERVEDIPLGPAIVLANEFFDALPVRQFVRRGKGWAERWVEAGAIVERRDAAFVPGLPAWAEEGAVFELGEVGAAVMRGLAARGDCVVLALDYGPAESGFGASLQGMLEGRAVDPLAGEGDVTAHVDFAALGAAARWAGAAVYGPVPQGIFLQRLGLASRAAMLAQARPMTAGAQLAAAQRLLAPEAMGRLFKALAVCDARLPVPPGFEEA